MNRKGGVRAYVEYVLFRMENVILKNGKTLEEALKIVAAPRTATNQKQEKSYYNIGEHFDRMDEVFGRSGYIAKYTHVPPIILPNGQVMLQCHCHIGILGRDNTEVFSCEGIGGCEISFSKDVKRYINLSTITTNCDTFAFKAACKEMRIFDCRRADEDEDDDSEIACKGNKQSSNATKNSKAVAKQRFFLKKALEHIRDDRETGKPIYVMVAQRYNGEVLEDGECQIIFYPNQYKNHVAKLNELVCRSKSTQKGFPVTLGVSELSNERNKNDYIATYLFKNFGGDN